MKIAIPTDNKKGLNDKVADHFGRAKFFLVYDTEKKNFEIFENPEAAGSGKFPPDFLHRQKIEAVIVFGLGPMAYNKFQNYRTEMHKAVQGSIADNLKKFEVGELRKLGEKDIF